MNPLRNASIRHCEARAARSLIADAHPFGPGHGNPARVVRSNERDCRSRSGLLRNDQPQTPLADPAPKRLDGPDLSVPSVRFMPVHGF
jgi:hypothetical protein